MIFFKYHRSSYFLRFLFLCTSFSFWYYMSIYLQSVFHLSPITTGSLLIFTTGFNFITALNIHKLLERKTNISLLIQGIIISIIGMVALALCIYYHSQIILFIPSLILIGIGQGFIFTPLTNLGMHNVSTDQSGIASGLVNFSHQIGSSTGVVLELVLATFILSYTGEPHDNLTFYTIVIGTVIQFLMLAYIIIVFKKSKNKYEF
ncbi:MFS transporter [Staphylococcus ureilyticus]|uniref:MFS transporter n=1 Tax=Staphylococcus ureilyticus TaxID=94138 RepID=UPI0023515CF1|nr:MFS transporter [Staphylococcus ureilyticus]